MPKAKDAVARRFGKGVKGFVCADQGLAITSNLGDKMKLAALRMIMAVMLGLAVAGCTAQYNKHGYVPPQAELDRIELGVDTRDTVAAILGRPSTAGLLNDVGWYYVESRWRTVGALAPVEQDRQVVAITYTPEGVVENVERFGLEKGQVVALSRRVTKPNVKSAGFLRQLFGNLGRVNTENLLSQ